MSDPIKVPHVLGPTKPLCYATPPLDGSQGNPMVHCDRKEGHGGQHTWEMVRERDEARQQLAEKNGLVETILRQDEQRRDEDRAHFAAFQQECTDAALADAQRENQRLKEWNDTLTRGKSPCGHWSAYAVTADGGKQIDCLQCQADALATQLRQVREALDKAVTWVKNSDCCYGGSCIAGHAEEQFRRIAALAAGAEDGRS